MNRKDRNKTKKDRKRPKKDQNKIRKDRKRPKQDQKGSKKSEKGRTRFENDGKRRETYVIVRPRRKWRGAGRATGARRWGDGAASLDSSDRSLCLSHRH